MTTMIILTGRHRYRQAQLKDTLTMRRDLRRFLAGEIDILPGSRLRERLIAELDRAYKAGRRDAAAEEGGHHG